MALRVLARKLRCPATATIQRGAWPLVSPAAGSRPLTSRSSQNEGARRVRPVWRDFKELEKRVLLDMEKDKKTFEELSRAMDNLPRNIALTCIAGVVGITTVWPYLIGVLHGNKAINEDSEHSA